MAKKTGSVSPIILPWGAQGSTDDYLKYIRRDNSTPYSRVTNAFRRNVAPYKSTSPTQAAVDRGYKEYVNVSMPLNKED